MSKQMIVRLEVTKIYEFTLMAEDTTEALERCELVADRRLRKHLKQVEGEIPMKELSQDNWKFKIAEK